MPTGTLWVSRVTAQPDTYRAMVVPYDGSAPSAVMIRTAEGLRSFLSTVNLGEFVRDAAVEQATWRGLAVLKNVTVPMQAFEAHAA
jgi:hypothetical protein